MKGARKVKSLFATLVASLFVSVAVAAAPKSAGGIARGAQSGRGEMLIHSHNDYSQKRPFWGAYEAGADSIEADIFLVDGDLLVAHSRKELKKENTLRRLYLEPLRSVMRKNGGRARANGKPIQLLVDLKNGKPALDRLVEMIEKEGFRECFDIAKNPSAARLTVTGDHSKVEDLFTYPDFVFFDMPPTRVLADGQYRRVPLISHYARAYTRWRSGVMAEEDKEKIRAAVRQAHEKGSKFRLWGYPDNPEAWRLAMELGLDYINTDRPAAAAAFLRDLGAGAEGESSAATAGAFEWDFTKGLPEGGKPRACAVIGPQGLSPAQIARNVTGKDGAGVEFPEVKLPEAFAFEAEVVPFVAWTNEADRAAAATPRSLHIFDTMAVNYKPKCRDKGLQVMFRQAGDTWTAQFYAGLGDMTCLATGPSFTPKAGVPVRLRIEYDALGTVRWNLDGKKQESYLAKAGPIVPDPTRRPVVGDRICSLYGPFNGYIRRIAVTPLARPPLALRPDGRRAFERGETNAAFAVSAFYRGPGSLKDVTCEIDERDPADGKVYKRMEWKGLLKLEAGKWAEFFVKPLETCLRPGKYPVSVRLAGRTPDGTAVAVTNTFDIAIGPVFADRMPAVMWGSSGTDEVVRDFGFTHVLRYDGLASPECTREQARQITDMYDRALAAGMRMMHSQGVRYPDGDVEKFFRCRRDGTPYADSRGHKLPEVSNPELVDYARRIVAAEMARVGGHPAFAGVLPCSELRDHTAPSFRTEHLRYKAETGRDVPPEVTRKTFDLKSAEARFPDGVVPVDDPIYAYYSWFWGGGDGWPGYTGAIADEYRKTAGRYGDGSAAQKRRPFFSFWDPAVRCPPKWGSGGDVDVLNQWVYALPEPMNVAGPAEEILAMAAGRAGQQPMIMTQLICYRAQLAPSNVVVSPLPMWVQKRPRAGFPTIPADSLQEAVWSMIAKPVKGIMFHGWGTIAETGSETGYTYTSPESAARLRELLNGLVAPLGPTLKELGREEPEVAVLESFATAAMGGPASWGWLSPAITFCQRARLDPRVVYEETVMRDGFGRTKILYAPQCRFLSAPVVEKIKAFQKAGGMLVADEKLLPALKADIVVPVMAYKTPPKSDHTEDVNAATKTMVNTAARRFTEQQKAWMLAEADKLRAALAAKCAYAPKADSSSPEIVTYSRAWGGTPYVFAVNDKRTFGDYVGQWGLTMEKGLPFAGEVTLADPEGRINAVYELSRGGEVKFSRRDRRVAVPLSYDTNDGRLLLFLPQKIASVEAEATNAGDVLSVTMTVRDAAGEPVKALLPVEIHVYDAEGRELDGAGYACAKDGVCKLTVRTNINDAPGGYRVVCRDRASGLACERWAKNPPRLMKVEGIPPEGYELSIARTASDHDLGFN